MQEEISSIEWSVYGKVLRVTRTANIHSKSDLEFAYDPMGNRVMKIVKPRAAGVLSNQVDWTYTYYVRDAQGNVMATYERTYDPAGNNAYSEAYKLKEKNIYGSSRIGMCTETVTLVDATFNSTGFTNNLFNAPTNYVAVNPPISPGTDFIHKLGEKEYEFGNHLGNVLVTASDRKLSIDNTADNTTDHYLADVLSQNDYYAFGMQMPERSNLANGYKYGFNGMEKDDEMKGSGNSYDFLFRIHDTRLGRFLSLDPLASQYPWNSPYAFAENRVIQGKDLEGLEYFNSTLYNTILNAYEAKLKQTGANSNALLFAMKVSRGMYTTGTLQGQAESILSYGQNLANQVYSAKSPEDITKVAEQIISDNTGSPDGRMVAGIIMMGVDALQGDPDAIGGVLGVAANVVGFKAAPNGKSRSGYGDLTISEVNKIQSVVNEAGRPIEVGGSAANGTRKGIHLDGPIQKGVKSDIDYLSSPSSIEYFKGLENKLPGLDPKSGIIPGLGNPHIGPVIQFQPGGGLIPTLPVWAGTAAGTTAAATGSLSVTKKEK